jgi:hypothetical protein
MFIVGAAAKSYAASFTISAEPVGQEGMVESLAAGRETMDLGHVCCLSHSSLALGVGSSP